MDDNKELVEKMLVAFLTEKSAQCGEPFYMDMWEEYKREKPDEYHEEFVQMQCALSIIQPELDKRDAIIEAAKDVLCAANQDSNAVMQMELRKLEAALKTTTGHDNNTEKRGKR